MDKNKYDEILAQLSDGAKATLLYLIHPGKSVHVKPKTEGWILELVTLELAIVRGNEVHNNKLGFWTGCRLIDTDSEANTFYYSLNRGKGKVQ